MTGLRVWTLALLLLTPVAAGAKNVNVVTVSGGINPAVADYPLDLLICREIYRLYCPFYLLISHQDF